MQKLFKQKNKLSRGFTLVETLVAISIFTTSILGLLAVLGQGVANTNYAKTKMITSYLAQEGIEYIKNMRDTYVLYDTTSSAHGWDAFNTKLATYCAGAGGCYLDDQSLDFSGTTVQAMTALVPTTCSSNCATLLYDSAIGKYGYTATGTTTSTGFVRKITAVHPVTATYPGGDPNEVKITSTVSWTQASGNYNVSFAESLFNWIE